MPACFSPQVAEPKSAATDPLYDRADDHAVLRPFWAFGIGWVRTQAVVPRPSYPGRRTQADVPRVALRSTMGFLMLPRWGVRGNAPRLGSLFAKTHKVFHYVDELLLVDELLQILRHQGFLLLLQLIKLAGWNRPLDPLRVLDAHRLRCLRD